MTDRAVQTANTGPGDTASRLSPSQRAAVVISLLGEAAAKPIIERLDDHALQQVSRGLETIAHLSREELTAITMDFLAHLRRSADGFRGGKAVAADTLARLVEPKRLSSVFDGPTETAPTQTDAWTRLAALPPARVSDYVATLTPNIAAHILNRLTPEQASQVLGGLEGGFINQVIICMIEAPDLDSGLEAVIARMIEIELLNTVDAGAVADASALEPIAELMSLISADKREGLIRFLNDHDADKLSGIQKSLFTIESLPERLPRNAVPVIFKQVDREQLLDVLHSLNTSHPNVADFLLSNISSRMADQFRDELSDRLALAPDAIDDIQRQFLTSLMGLKRRGEIVLE